MNPKLLYWEEFIYSCNGIPFSSKTEQTDTCYNIDDP